MLAHIKVAPTKTKASLLTSTTSLVGPNNSYQINYKMTNIMITHTQTKHKNKTNKTRTRQCLETTFSRDAISIFNNSDLDLDLIDPKINPYLCLNIYFNCDTRLKKII